MNIFQTPRAAESQSVAKAVGFSTAAPTWNGFQKLRHRKEVPITFDEDRFKFDGWGAAATEDEVEDKDRVSHEQQVLSSRSQRRVAHHSISSNGSCQRPPASVEDDFGLRKARFFNDCLRADRELDPSKLPPSGVFIAPTAHLRAQSQSAQKSYSLEEQQANAFALPVIGLDSFTMDASESRAEFSMDGSFPAIYMEDSERQNVSVNESMVDFVTSCRDAKIFPITTGLIRLQSEKLKLEYGALTDARARAFNQPLRASSAGVQDAQFRSNGLTDSGAKHVLTALPESVLSIDISQNVLGRGPSWCHCFERLTQLKSLSVADCQLGDSTCKALCNALSGCKDLTTLDLSANSICAGAKDVADLLGRHFRLQRLDMHWNGVTGEAARDLMSSFLVNGLVGGALNDVNLSWNPLGKVAGEDTCQQLSQVFAENRVLTHVDLSECELGSILCRILAVGLRKNSTLLGLHMGGNEAYVNPQGFITPLFVDKSRPAMQGAADSQDSKEELDAEAKTAAEFDYGKTDVRYGSSCWICERWREICLMYTPGISGPSSEEIWVFTSADNFSHATRMIPYQGNFLAYVMAPAGVLRFVFQAGTMVLASRTAPLLRETQPRVRIRRVRLSSESNEVAVEGSPELPRICDVEVTVFSFKLVTERKAEEPVCQVIVPRQGKLVEDTIRTPAWDVESSLFAPYEDVYSRRTLWERCFDADWRQSSVSRVLKETKERLDVRDFLRGLYPHTMSLYLSLCSIEKVSWGKNERLVVGLNVHQFTRMLVQHCLIGDEMTLDEADAQFLLAAVPSKECRASHPGAHAKGRIIFRHNFLELLVRLALCCFAKHLLMTHKEGAAKQPSKAKTAGYALELFFNRFVMQPAPAVKDNSKCVQWRREVLHTQHVEGVFRKHMQTVLEPCFFAYMQRGHIDKQYLMLEDWFALLNALEVFPCDGNSLSTNAWDRAWLWQMSSMWSVDELHGTEHLELSFVEFLEAIGRTVALRHARGKMSNAVGDESNACEYSFEIASPSSAFCADKEIMDAMAFAQHLDSFLRTELPKAQTGRSRKKA